MTKYLEDWAPPGVAWERDNVGLQVGSGGAAIKNIMLCLELNDEVLDEAIHKKCNFIFTHHPLIFNPIKKLDTGKDPLARLIDRIIKNNITVYSAHTNLDFTKGGVSFELAETLGLENISFLEPSPGNQFKIAVFAPQSALDKISAAVFGEGAGRIGEYENCSFASRGEGTFKGSENSNPRIGKKNRIEKVDEVRFEFITDSWKIDKVVAALRKSHPYEEPAFDIIPLKNASSNYGAGAIGELKTRMSEKAFLAHVSRSLKTRSVKYCLGKEGFISKVAVCGGSGSELLNSAISRGADAFVTADIKYHAYQEADGKILMIDAGHYETEIAGLNAVSRKIKKFITVNSDIKILKYSGSTNPVKFYKQ
ncbi:MAG: Nif3-like dinuclear metal center hexameric protein [Melioribacteraceae bacterium]